MGAHNQQVEVKADRVTLRRIRRQLRQESAFVHLLRVVTSVSNESSTIEEPLQTALDAVCALTGWPIGHALLKTDEKEELNSTGLWHLDAPERFETFRKVSEALTFGGGVGLPGRVLADGAPAWIPDVSKDTNFPRNRLVHDLGLRAAFAFPILVGREVAGVLEFFHTERVDPDEAILMVMNQVGVQLGRIIERRRAEQTLSSLAQGIVAQKGEDFFQSLVAHLAKSVKADYALAGEVKEGRDAVRAAAELERKRAEETAQKLAEVPRANPHPVLEFSGEGALRFSNTAAHVLARSMGKDDPIHILPADTAGIVRKCLDTGKNGIVVDRLADERTIIWSFIPIVKNDSVFAHAFELTLFLDLHDEMRRMGGLSPRHRGRKHPSNPGSISMPRRSKERVH